MSRAMPKIKFLFMQPFITFAETKNQATWKP
jgi:hypothetical protein